MFPVATTKVVSTGTAHKESEKGDFVMGDKGGKKDKQKAKKQRTHKNDMKDKKKKDKQPKSAT